MTRLIYRGFKDRLENGKSINIFKDKPRIPIDSKQFVHDISDNWFNDFFGIFARSQTIICSTDIDQALRYSSSTGSIAAIAPIGIYNIIYSEDVEDFLEHAYEIHEISEINIKNWLQSKKYKCVDDINHIPSHFKGEIMVDCTEFHVRNL